VPMFWRVHFRGRSGTRPGRRSSPTGGHSIRPATMEGERRCQSS
jgi:hypothetical protein